MAQEHTPLSASAIAVYRDRLLDERQQLLDSQDHDREISATVDLDQTSVGRLSRMDALQGQAMAVAIAQRHRQHLVDIDAALRRIEAGDFGLCEDCEQAIAPGRLDINPAVRRCVHCSA